MRIGQGYDVHRLVVGRKLILGGVTIPYEKGLLGHSDADVLSHAIIDAILGALALGDIGAHFPDTDSAYEGISSQELLRRVVKGVIPENAQIVNVDATLVAQRPKLASYIPQMRKNISEALGVTGDRISVKATTTEGLGSEGLGEGISAQAVALVNLGEG
ncbi:MAG: 2-C-methyl-D-erythritol 2,4-cyclodiphosphate synthase [Candidatus Latescibacterota bacterium]